MSLHTVKINHDKGGDEQKINVLTPERYKYKNLNMQGIKCKQ